MESRNIIPVIAYEVSKSIKKELQEEIEKQNKEIQKQRTEMRDEIVNTVVFLKEHGNNEFYNECLDTIIKGLNTILEQIPEKRNGFSFYLENTAAMVEVYLISAKLDEKRLLEEKENQKVIHKLSELKEGLWKIEQEVKEAEQQIEKWESLLSEQKEKHDLKESTETVYNNILYQKNILFYYIQTEIKKLSNALGENEKNRVQELGKQTEKRLAELGCQTSQEKEQLIKELEILSEEYQKVGRELKEKGEVLSFFSEQFQLIRQAAK